MQSSAVQRKRRNCGAAGVWNRTGSGDFEDKSTSAGKRGELMFQLEAFTKTQAFHRNLNPEAAGEILAVVMEVLDRCNWKR